MKNILAVRIIVIIVSVLAVIGVSVGTVIVVNNIIQPDITEIKDGLSAYELAVKYGYEGTVQEWLNSLNGKTAYEIAKENGYTGNEDEWLASLKASAGKDGVGIKTAAFSESNELLITLTDDTVLNLGVAVGADGKDGQYILVFPDKNAVVVTTANISDMQSELNLIWEHIYPAL